MCRFSYTCFCAGLHIHGFVTTMLIVVNICIVGPIYESDAIYMYAMSTYWL